VPPNSAGGQAAHHSCAPETGLLGAAQKFWGTYYNSLLTSLGRGLTEPVKDRDLGTTSARHVREFEKFWGDRLATAIDVPRSQVGKRKVRLAAPKPKSFDVCWPSEGEATILTSVKGMQNAYRNLTKPGRGGLRRLPGAPPLPFQPGVPVFLLRPGREGGAREV
jgi:hypothetical protein